MKDFFQCAYWCGILNLAENFTEFPSVCLFEKITMCLLLVITHSTLGKVLYWVGTHFLFNDGKTDGKRQSGLPWINSLVCCLFKALGTHIFYLPMGSLQDWRQLAGPQFSSLEVTRLRSIASPQLPLQPFYKMAMEIISQGQPLSCFVLWPKLALRWLKGCSRVDWLAPSGMSHASLWTCLLSDTSWSWSCKGTCACLQRKGTYCIPAHTHGEKGLDFHAAVWDAV